MWQRLTERARRVVFFAQEEAGKRGTSDVGPGHLLLGILRETDNVAVRVLKTMSIDLDSLGDDVRRLIPMEPGTVTGGMTLSGGAKRVIDLAYDEARRLENRFIGTEHLLLGLIHDRVPLAGGALLRAGVQLSATRVFVAALQETSSVDAARRAVFGAANAPGTEETSEVRFSDSAHHIIELAKREARALGETFYSTEHLLLAIVHEPSALVSELLDRLGVSPTVIESELRRQVARGDGHRSAVIMPTPRVKRVLTLAHNAARDLAYGTVEPYLLMGLVAEAEGLAGRVLHELGINSENLRTAYDAMRLDPLNAGVGIKSRLDAQLHDLRQRIAELPNAEAFEAPQASSYGDTPAPNFGDLGVASPTPGRTQIEVAHDAAAFRSLLSVFLAKDAYGYRTLTDGDQTVFLLPTETPLKLLVPPPNTEDVVEEGLYVRVLAGDYAGYAGWVFKDAFKRTGFDASAFPPPIEGS